MGVVSSEDHDPVIGASVLVEGSQSGCMTDASGGFYIPRLSPGEYSITVRMVGMASVTVHGISVVSDQNTIMNVELAEEAVGSTVITVTGQRNIVLENVPSSIQVVDRSEIQTMAVSGIIDVLQSQAGVNTRGGEIHVRGGRSGEVDFLLEGASMRSPVTNSYSAGIPLSAIAEASTITGGFGAEYGNALSGVVKMVAREGGSEYDGNVRLGTGDNTAFGLESSRRDYSAQSENDEFRSDCLDGEVSIGGPEPLSSYLLPSLGINIPGKASLFTAMEWSRSGFDLEDSRGNWENNWQNNLSGLVNLTYRPDAVTGISVLGRYSYRQSGWDEWAWSAYDEPVYIDGEPYLGGNWDYALPIRFDESWGITAGINRLLGRSTVVETMFDRSVFSQWSRIRDEEGGYIGEEFTPSAWYGEFFPGRVSDSLGFFRNGIHSSIWLDSKSVVYSGRIGITSQLGSVVKLETGLEGKLYDIYDYGVTSASPEQTWVNIWKADPRSYAFFAQTSSNFSGAMVLNTGARIDVFDPATRMTVPGESGSENVPLKIQISPRFGITHPISERDVFFATYGRYFQMPSLNQMFSGTNYNMSGDYSIVGNPDLDAVRTISYEAGVRHRTGDLSTFSFSAFYKEITGLVQTSPLSDETGFFFMYENDDSYATVQGAEATFLQLPGRLFSGNLSYTYSIAEGRYSSPVEQYQYSSQGYAVIPVDDNYLDWDQRHLLNARINMSAGRGEGPLVAGFRALEGASIGLSWSYGSGYPYSPNSEAFLPEINTERQPWTMNTDLLMVKKIRAAGLEIDLRFSVFNLFNRANIERIYDPDIYAETGIPGGAAGNPAAFSPSRHLFFSLGVAW